MSKKHKKPSPVQQQKLITAHKRNEFFQKLKHVLTEMSGNPDTIKFLPPRQFEAMFHFRFQSIRAEPAEGHLIEEGVLKEIKAVALELIRNEILVVNNFGGMITLEEYLTVAVTLLSQLQTFKPEAFKTAAHFIVSLEPYLTANTERNYGWEASQRVMDSTSIVKSDLGSCLYWTLIKAEMHLKDKHECYMAVKVFKHTQEKIQVTIDGLSRPAVRVGWGDYEKGMKWCSRPPASFGLPQRDITHLLPVYIQMHALQRLAERLDCIDRGTVHYFVYLAVKYGRIHKGQNDHYLIEFHFLDMKAGYLLAKVHDNMIIIRTFLFLTNNGTPEGLKLGQLTGLRKHDKKYLALDKLSTFMDPNLRDNEPIQRLFFDAGCSDLFEITQDLVADAASLKPRVTEKVLLDYLMLKPRDAEPVQNEGRA